MKTRKLGGSGLDVSPICLGGNVFGWTADEAASFAILDAFVGAGFNFVDTADVYSRWVPGHKGGESETVLGNWFKRSGNRKKVILATKVGIELAPDKKGLSKAYILREVEDSLQRLQTDYIDLYQSHIDDATVPLEETLGAYDQLIKQGKVRAIGASNYRAERLAEALEISKQHGLPRYECLQPHYNLYERAAYEQDLEPLCVKEGIGVIPYFALASGFLTGKYRAESDFSKGPRGQMVKKYLDDRGRRILAALDEVAAKLHSTQGKVAIAWLIARPSISSPIASATNVEQLKDLVDAASLQLDPDSIKTLNDASAY
ncbi:MAG TPA: aldo/keto reductase [Bryobacteraceae bacterium]|jgi:aryl-alcohol dehydrogenase-like predicted oxidoreductase|nr:aldo/keto reductase [Bryobacteraceae bacterium]